MATKKQLQVKAKKIDMIFTNIIASLRQTVDAKYRTKVINQTSDLMASVLGAFDAVLNGKLKIEIAIKRAAFKSGALVMLLNNYKQNKIIPEKLATYSNMLITNMWVGYPELSDYQIEGYINRMQKEFNYEVK